MIVTETFSLPKDFAMHPQDLLDEKVIYCHGHYQRVRRWWRGVHPGLGAIIRGLTGWETVEERDCIRPHTSFHVITGGPGRS
jgi:hypothetical protein